MSGMHSSWQEFRQGLAERVGIRAGLALSDDRIDHHLGLCSDDSAPEGIVRISPTQFGEALYSALLGCGSRWCDLGPRPRIEAWQQLDQDTELYVAAHDLVHREVHRQDVASEYTTHDTCRLINPSDIGVPESLRGPLAVGTNDMFVLNSRLDDLDFALVGGQALELGGDALVRATRLLIEALRCEQHIDPWLRCNTAQAASIAQLNDLFTQADCPSRSTQFFDQRFIDFLVVNIDDLALIHWRQFERLVAEHFHREGYAVELGPGVNDDGVDIRMWPSEADQAGPALLIVQCKRVREKVEKVVVKGLWADMQSEGAARGMVATTRSISPGAQDTITARGYAIDSADREAIANWLEIMRTPRQGPSLI